MLFAIALLLTPVNTCDVTAMSPISEIEAVTDWDHGREDDFFYSVITLDGGTSRTCDSGASRTFQEKKQLYCTFSNAISDGTRSFHCDNMSTPYDMKIEFTGRVAADGTLVVDGATPIEGSEDGSTFTYRYHQISLYGARVELGPDGQPQLAMRHVKVYERDQPILDWNRRMTDRCTTLFSTTQEKTGTLGQR